MKPRTQSRPGPSAVTEKALPLYRRVKRDLLKMIETGRHASGKALPSEALLAASLQVSIGTLRHAVDELVHEHVLVRHQGKGTFVAPHSKARFMFQFFHVEPRPDPEDSEPVRAPEYPDIACIGFTRDVADMTEARALRIKVGDPVWRIANRLALHKRPVVLDRITLPVTRFRSLTERQFIERPSTLYALYQTDFGITVVGARERARAVAADRVVARALAMPEGLPVIEVHRLALTFGDKPVEYRVSSIDTRAHDYVSSLSGKS